jgi:uncharacterized protein (TIGR03067 family)
MPSTIHCPTCHATCVVNDQFMGKNVGCSRCQTVFSTVLPAAEVTTNAGPAADDEAAIASGIQSRPGLVPLPSTTPALPLRTQELTAAAAPPSSPAMWLVPLLVGGAVVCFLLLALVGVVGAVLWANMRSSTPPDQAAATSPAPGTLPPADKAKKPDHSKKSGAGVAAEGGKQEGTTPDQTKPGGTLPPDSGPAPAKPPVLAQDRVAVKLPGRVAEVAVGGGGRFLILHLAQQRQLAVFDVNEAKVVKYLPLAGDNVKFAASLDKLVVVLTDERLIQRWSLVSFEREVSAPLGVSGVVKAVAMGSSSRGPLLMYWAVGTGALDSARVDLVDLGTLKSKDPVGNEPREYSYRDIMHFRASADGQVFGAWCTSHTPSGVTALVVTGGKLKRHYEHNSWGHVVPGADGKILYTGAGTHTPQLQKAAGGPGGHALPAHGGLYCFAVHTNDRPGPPRTTKATSLTVHLVGDARPLVTVNNVEVPVTNDAWTSSDFTWDKRVHLVPEAKVLITLPDNADEIVLQRLDIDAALEKSGADYLMVTSRPPAVAAAGRAFAYQLAAKAKKGGVKYRLESGPPGMAVSPAGLVSWQVPADATVGGEVTVLLTVADAAGQEVFHTFKLVVADAAAGNVAGPAGKDPGPVAKTPDPQPEPKDQGKTPPPLAEKPALAIRPPALDQAKVRKALPGTFDDVAVGGGGRYLIFHLPQPRQLAIFDVNEAKVVKYLPVAEDGILFTAGLDKLVVVLRGAKLIQRWSLTTFERELSVALDVRDAVSVIAMGSASRGPILVADAMGVSRSHFDFFDLATLMPMNVKKDINSHIHIQEHDGVRASADGTVFTFWRTQVSPQGIQTLLLIGKEVKGNYDHDSAGYLVPGPDGKVIYTARGLYSNTVKAMGKQAGQPWRGYLPAHHGPYYLSFTRPEPFAKGKGGSELAVHVAGDQRPLVRLSDVEMPIADDPINRDRLGVDKRVHLLPDANLIITLPLTNDALVLHRFDVDAALAKSDLDYLMVTSSPPTTAVRGTMFTYQVVAKARKGGLKYRVEAGPKGMAVSAAGQLTWAVPAAGGEDTAQVILSIGDAAGQETFQTFKLDLVAGGAKGDNGPAPKGQDEAPGGAGPGVQGAMGIKGQWKLVRCEFEGQEQKQELTTQNRWIISEDKITIFTGGPKGDQNRGSWQYKLNPVAEPAAIDLMVVTGTAKGTVLPSIYRLEGDMLIVCIQNFPERGRPKASYPQATA